MVIFPLEQSQSFAGTALRPDRLMLGPELLSPRDGNSNHLPTDLNRQSLPGDAGTLTAKTYFVLVFRLRGNICLTASARNSHLSFVSFRSVIKSFRTSNSNCSLAPKSLGRWHSWAACDRTSPAANCAPLAGSSEAHRAKLLLCRPLTWNAPGENPMVDPRSNEGLHLRPLIAVRTTS